MFAGDNDAWQVVSRSRQTYLGEQETQKARDEGPIVKYGSQAILRPLDVSRGVRHCTLPDLPIVDQLHESVRKRPALRFPFRALGPISQWAGMSRRRLREERRLSPANATPGRRERIQVAPKGTPPLALGCASRGPAGTTRIRRVYTQSGAANNHARARARRADVCHSFESRRL